MAPDIVRIRRMVEAGITIPFVDPSIDEHGQSQQTLVMPLVGAISQGRATDAGWDLPASGPVVLNPRGINEIPTGVRIKIPDGFYARILPRSSAVRRGINVIDGTIDAGYVGELSVFCQVDRFIPVTEGERVAQLVFFPVIPVVFIPVDRQQILPGERGEAGFGSTGL